MSTKKLNISYYFSKRLRELMSHLGYANRQQSKFANDIGVTASFLSDVLNKKSGPSFSIVFGISDKFPEVDISWLLTGEGEMFRGSQKDEFFDKDPATAEIISKARKIIHSGTEYSASLAADIRSFHQAITAEKRLNNMESQFQGIKNIVEELTEEFRQIKERLKNCDSSIREKDLPENKDQIFKKKNASE